jgi:hypothetical protein
MKNLCRALAAMLLATTLPAIAAGEEYQLVDLSACRKPAKAPPALPAESHRIYNVQRRFVDLDQDGVCEVMDVWIERLGDDPSPGMRSLEHGYFRYRAGKWQAFASDLRYYPYAIRSAKAGNIIYIEAPTAADIGDDMALGTQETRLLAPAGWDQSVPGTLATLKLVPFQGIPGPILDAAVKLSGDARRFRFAPDQTPLSTAPGASR